MNTLDALNMMLTDILGPRGPMIGVSLVLIFVIMAAVPLILSRREDPIDKFKRAQKEGAAGKDSRKH